MFEGLHIDLVLSDQLPKCTPIFLGTLGCFGDVALMNNQKFLNVGSLKFVDHANLSFLERLSAYSGFLTW